jgi:hypothetical protein
MFEAYEERSLSSMLYGLEEGVRIISEISFCDLNRKGRALTDVYYAICHKLTQPAQWTRADVLEVGQGYSIWLKGERDYYILYEHDRVIGVDGWEAESRNRRCSGTANVILKSGIRLKVFVSADSDGMTLSTVDCDFASADAREHFWSSATEVIRNFWHLADLKNSSERDGKAHNRPDQSSAEETTPQS